MDRKPGNTNILSSLRTLEGHIERTFDIGKDRKEDVNRGKRESDKAESWDKSTVGLAFGCRLEPNKTGGEETEEDADEEQLSKPLGQELCLSLIWNTLFQHQSFLQRYYQHNHIKDRFTRFVFKTSQLLETAISTNPSIFSLLAD